MQKRLGDAVGKWCARWNVSGGVLGNRQPAQQANLGTQQGLPFQGLSLLRYAAT